VSPGQEDACSDKHGLLVVNADDFGGNRLASDRILHCFAAGGITSTSAMVYMSDSRRAAELVRASGLPVGLHLNLTQEFEDEATPAAVRSRQARARRHLSGQRLTRVAINPPLIPLIKRCIADQLACFRELYGGEPTHIDGHNHVHLSPTVLLALPRGVAVRTADSNPEAQPGLGTVIRRARHRFIAHRQLSTERFFAIDPVAASPTAMSIEALLANADSQSVEVMTHPDRDRDYALLMSAQWLQALKRRTVGSFRDLPARPARDDARLTPE
jgi:predicted glycoside hydrolase/deacetylase ChbG (UPF0249 family)